MLTIDKPSQMELLYQARDYKSYLKNWIERQSDGGRGLRSRLAVEIGCQKAFVSQVLDGPRHFSLEHGVRINSFLNHNRDEGRYFIILMNRDRAGSKELESFFDQQMKEIRSQRREVRKSIQVERQLDFEHAAIYYSQWFYSAIHMLVGNRKHRNVESIAKALQIPITTAELAVNFLTSVGLVNETKTGYERGAAFVHIDRDSPLSFRHHANWRWKSLQRLETPNDIDLHFSSVISLSEKEFVFIKDVLLRALTQIKAKVETAKDEKLVSLCIDLFMVEHQ